MMGSLRASFVALREQIGNAASMATNQYLQPVEPEVVTPEIPAHRPASWDDYVGQDRIRRRVKIALASALARDQRAEHMLLLSAPGQGKTTLASLIAAELDRPLVILTKPPKVDQLLAACETAEFGVLFVDEVHAWNESMQGMLMQLTESGMLDTPFGSMDYRFITVIAATTEEEEDQLLPPLVDRFGVKLRFDPYTTEDMLRIAEGLVERCWPWGHELPDHETCMVLAEASAGVPRNLRALIFAGRDLVLAGEEPSPESILTLCDTDPDGCTMDHLRLLERLSRSPRGTAGLATLAAMLRVHPVSLRRTERLLVDRGYVIYQPSGRMITPAGRARLAAGSIRDAS